MKRYIRASSNIQSYSEFKSTYSWAVKKYPEVTNLFDDGVLEDGFSKRYRITLTKENYTKNGSRWTKENSNTGDCSVIEYMNALDAVPFFKNLGGSERVSTAYTFAGVLPVEITSISPDKEQKTVRKYTISNT